MITGPFEFVAQVPGRDGVHDYRYVETNVDAFVQPLYRLQPHYSPPLHAHLHRVDTAEIRKTMLHVTSIPTTNGYALTLDNPIPHAWYLLMVRDKYDLQLRASGYFTSGATREPIHLQVDKKGMMSDGQSLIALPAVKFLPDVVEPKFTAGWGEDSDGDGLPDIYEVLVTQTDPTDADKGNTSTLDGYKDLALDGWSVLEKFRCRSNPSKAATPPATVELIKPTGREIMKAIAQKTDLPFELQLEARTNGATDFEPMENLPTVFYNAVNFRQAEVHKDFDVRVSWRVPKERAQAAEDPRCANMPSPEQTIETLEGKANLKLFEASTNDWANGPALSRIDFSNRMVAMNHAYRQGDIDKGTTQTDGAGLFQFIGIKGDSLSITPEKAGYQIEGHGLGLKGLNGPETSPENPTVYTMWKLKGPEPMMHSELNSRKIQPDGRVYTIDFVKSEIIEGTNAAGDMLVQIQRPPKRQTQRTT